MGTIVVSDNISLDGVIQDPAGDEGFGRGGCWGNSVNERFSCQADSAFAPFFAGNIQQSLNNVSGSRVKLE